jgi:hypothetical protein
MAGEHEARQRAEHELTGARARLDAEAALRARTDGELERMRAGVEQAQADARLARAELTALRERGTDELRALVAAVQGGAVPDTGS